MEATPEVFTVGVTISPPLQKCIIDAHSLMLKFEPIHKCLKRFCKTYELYPEFDKGGRLHYHGILCCYDRIKFNRCAGTLRRFGFIKYETRSRKGPLDVSRWLEYCQKELELTQKVVPEVILPLTENSIKLIRRYVTHRNKPKSTLVQVWESDPDEDSGPDLSEMLDRSVSCFL